MKLTQLFTFIVCLSYCGYTNAQNTSPINESNRENWTVHNRRVTFENEIIHLNAMENDGLLWLNGSEFGNGTIEADIKGKNVQGQSFVGIAFHGTNNSTYDAIYFRPFNFQNPDRDRHSVQYISHPGYTWHKLREEHPNEFENWVSPVPEPNDWFHVKILVEFPVVKVFIDNALKPTLEVKQLSNQKEGLIGFWVGNNSEGHFKNLKVISE